MLADDTVQLRRFDGCLPRAWVVTGGTAWDDLLFRGLWLCGWEVHLVTEEPDQPDKQADVIVVAPTWSSTPARLPQTEAPTLVLVPPSSRGTRAADADSSGARVMSYEVGVMRILQACEVIAAASLERVPALELDEWIDQ